MFIKIYKAMIENICRESFKGAELFILSRLAGFPEESCFPSMQFLADELKIDVWTVKQAISRLKRSGWIATTAHGKYKTGFKYTFTNKYADAMKRWTQARADQEPPFWRVESWMLDRFGCNVSCMLIAIMYQLKSRFDESGDSEAVKGNYPCYCYYGQAQLANMCGCSIITMKKTIAALCAENVIEKQSININWSKSKLSYEFSTQFLEEIARYKNPTNKIDVGIKTPPINDDSRYKNPTIIENNSLIDNSLFQIEKAAPPCLAEKPFSAAASVENSESVTGGKELPALTGQEISFSEMETGETKQSDSEADHADGKILTEDMRKKQRLEESIARTMDTLNSWGTEIQTGTI